MDRDEAVGARALERAEALLDLRGRQAEAPMPGEFDGDEIAILRRSPWHRAGSSSSRPSCFLSIGPSRPPPIGSTRNTTKSALPRAI